jgi:hypothetical protein
VKASPGGVQPLGIEVPSGQVVIEGKPVSRRNLESFLSGALKFLMNGVLTA